MPTYMNSFSDEFGKIAMSPAGQALNLRANATVATKGLKNYARNAKADVLKKQRWPAAEAAEDRRVIRESTPAIKRVAQRLGFFKEAGEMQGFTRIGRKPISVEKMLENEAEIDGLPEEIVPSIQKAASAMVKLSKHRAAALVGGGAVGALVLRQMNEDRKLGRMIRKQQSQQQ